MVLRMASLPGLCSGRADPQAFGGGWRAAGGLYWVVPHGQHRDAAHGAKIHGGRGIRRGRRHATPRASLGGRGSESGKPAGAAGEGGDPAAGGPLAAAVGVSVSEWGEAGAWNAYYAFAEVEFLPQDWDIVNLFVSGRAGWGGGGFGRKEKELKGEDFEIVAGLEFEGGGKKKTMR
ncbi:hypothetical protein DID88_003697 [Monilinia fructigena]|uniref:Uncharacterized protein n=1 Tax=Monilinia fructigena TaxID=38457 RepID=A0A395IUX0_9HELO|nr:hypothetical protein DID88_003697 [Monilinia fructigena]